MTVQCAKYKEGRMEWWNACPRGGIMEYWNNGDVICNLHKIFVAPTFMWGFK